MQSCRPTVCRETVLIPIPRGKLLLKRLGVRFANRVIEPVWNAEHVESVLVRFDEALGLENRAGYYDKAGAMVDMIQSHLLQVLAFLAMDAPASLDERDLRDATGVEFRLGELGTDRNSLPELATEAAAQWTASFNPRPVSEADLLRLYEASF